MESNVLREDDTIGSGDGLRRKRLDGKKLPETGSHEDSRSHLEGKEMTMSESKGKSTVGFSYVKVVGKSNTDDLFEERMRAHKAEIDAFLAKHTDFRIER